MESPGSWKSYALAQELTIQSQANRIAILQTQVEEQFAIIRENNTRAHRHIVEMCEVHKASMKFVASLRRACTDYNDLADTLMKVFSKSTDQQAIPKVYEDNQNGLGECEKVKPVGEA